MSYIILSPLKFYYYNTFGKCYICLVMPYICKASYKPPLPLGAINILLRPSNIILPHKSRAGKLCY